MVDIFPFKRLILTDCTELYFQKECESKQTVLDVKSEELSRLQKVVEEQSEEIYMQKEEIMMLKRLFING